MHSTSQPLPIQFPKSLRGSSARCLDLTNGTNPEIAERLTALVTPHGHVDFRRHKWMPRGYSDSSEAKLGQAVFFLSAQQREIVTDWWLTVRPGANTPNWDIVSQATIGEREGLILVEAKAHERELSVDGKPLKANVSPNSLLNHQRIGDAITEASTALNCGIPGWNLSRDSHYQLANRFAWSWKIASLGVPVILVYLGFLNAIEMKDCGRPFDDAVDWEQVVLTYANGTVPPAAWQQEIQVPFGSQSIPLLALIRSQ